MLIAAHQQFGDPIVLLRDDLSVRPAAGLRAFAASWNWPPICCLPPYAPNVNPVEEVKTPGEAASCPTASSVPPNSPSSVSAAAFGTSSTAATLWTAVSPRPA
ncbi:hypothetical protein AAGT00_01475 [Streptomyces cavourensis]|uniref:hypothetical protein n=1 Tax=Streptomyces bacillaris TaxID=68179 RepID=UPI003675571E